MRLNTTAIVHLNSRDSWPWVFRAHVASDTTDTWREGSTAIDAIRRALLATTPGAVSIISVVRRGYCDVTAPPSSSYDVAYESSDPRGYETEWRRRAGGWVATCAGAWVLRVHRLGRRKWEVCPADDWTDKNGGAWLAGVCCAYETLAEARAAVDGSWAPPFGESGS